MKLGGWKVAATLCVAGVSTLAHAATDKACDVQTAKDLMQAKDYQKAVPCLEDAVAHDNGEAMLMLGNLYLNGTGVAPDIQKMHTLLLRAAALGEKMAFYNLGVLYEMGNLGKPDYAAAEKYYRNAAQLGVVEAKVNLGLMYLNGTKLPKNYKAGEELLAQAARSGSTQAEFNLGILYVNGYKEGPNAASVASWLADAALHGHPVAPQVLGMVYAKGVGVPADPVQAYTWFLISNENRYPDAKQSLAGIEPSLTPAQRQEAEQRARNWRYEQRAYAATQGKGKTGTPPVFHSRCAVLVKVLPATLGEHPGGEAAFNNLMDKANETTTKLIANQLVKYRLVPLEIRTEERQRTPELLTAAMASNDCGKGIDLTYAIVKDASGAYLDQTLTAYRSAAGSGSRLEPIYQKTYRASMKEYFESVNFAKVADGAARDIEDARVIDDIFR